VNKDETRRIFGKKLLFFLSSFLFFFSELQMGFYPVVVVLQYYKTQIHISLKMTHRAQTEPSTQIHTMNKQLHITNAMDKSKAIGVTGRGCP
jgi:uncharacterized protein YybS (DUF2232 family)